MRFGISRRDPVDQLYGRMRDAHAYLSRDSGGSRSSTTHRVTSALEMAGGAAGVGLLAGRLNSWNIPRTPIPLGLAIGVGLHALDLFGFGGGLGEHLSNVGNGAIASWASLIGAGYGQQLYAKANPEQPAALAAGTLGPGSAPQAMPARPHAPVMSGSRPRRGPLTEAELVAMSHRHR
jgi:hypothetical protein